MPQATEQQTIPPQSQNRQPGIEQDMTPQPLYKGEWYKGTDKLKGKVALITGGDSGIGRAVAIFFAREGADIAIAYLDEHEDASQTKRDVEAEGRKCILLASDLSQSKNCTDVVRKTVRELGKLDIVVNNIAYQTDQREIESLDDEQLEKTFQTNVYSYFYITREAVKHLPDQTGVIINTASITAYRGSGHVFDYSSTKGAIVSFTRSLSTILVDRGIRVNAVAPGPIWTPLIPASFPPEDVAKFGKDVPMGRPGQPEEVAASYVFLAARDSSYITGQVIHPNGGEPYTS
jgi:NAD(P)-dependent dehydrogenase (short-subunit alcohol dehydrogenase family)